MDKKEDIVKNNRTTDWELTDDFYHPDQSKPSLSIESFIEPGDLEKTVSTNRLEEVEKAAEDVKKILILMEQGKNTKEIASGLSLEESYVHNILMCIQAFPEDNPIAVAHLVLMG